MKKSRVLIIVIFCFLLIPFAVNAESIQDYKNKLAELESEKEDTANKSAEVQKKIDEAESKVNEISRQIAAVKEEQEQTRKEIQKLKVQIKEKEEEIKELVSFYQISENDNFYLKFIFGAESFEDFIYRFSVAEQLTEANNSLIKEMNDLIKENEKKENELKNQQKKLDGLNAQMQVEIKKLGKKKESYNKEGATYEEQIKLLKDQISRYKKICSSETQDVMTCGVKRSSSRSGGKRYSGAVSSNGFALPTSYGCIEDSESEFGYSPMRGRLHAGIDVSCVSLDTPVYAVADGYVTAVTWWTYGGNVIMIAHDNGYTSIYLHLNYTSVSFGDHVSRGQQIGGAGGSGGYPVHLHMEIMYGHAGYSWDATVDPRNFINFPPTGGSW